MYTDFTFEDLGGYIQSFNWLGLGEIATEFTASKVESNGTVIEENKNAYPELVSKKDFIVKSIKNEEDVFLKTIDKGMDMLSDYMEKAVESKISSFVQLRIPINGTFSDATYNGIPDLYP